MVPCDKIKGPATLPPGTNAGPGVCGFESQHGYASVSVGDPRVPTSFANLVANEKGRASMEHRQPIAYTQTDVPGWTFGASFKVGALDARWQYLVDAAGKVLLCKIASDNGPVAKTAYSQVCQSAKRLLYTK